MTGYAERVLSLTWEQLPSDVQEQAKRCFKDIVATAAGSRLLPVAGMAETLASEQFAPGDVPLWFAGRAACSSGAAFYNALAIDSLDCHDGFRPNKGHCGATVTPVAVGACVGHEIPGKDLLTAVVAGYELACRAGLVIHRVCAPVCHASGAWATIGAAAAAAKVQGIAAAEFDLVLGMAEYYAPMSPILRCTEHPSTVKDGAGAGAWAAAFALAMRACGMSGLPSLFAAESFGRDLIATFGDEWMIRCQYFKPYPTCRWTQPVVEGALALQREHGFTWREIEQFDVETFREGAHLVKFPPEHTDGAQYCTPWAVAAMLVDGKLGVAQIHPDRLRDPDILALGRRVKTHVAADLQARFPMECLARVTITLSDGRRLRGPTLGARGDYTHPLSSAELKAKFADLVAPVLGGHGCAALEHVLDTLEERSAGDLLALLRQRGRA